MNEGGLDLLWASHWWEGAGQKCGLGRKTEVKTVTLVDCQSAFYVLLLGLVVALLAALAESLFHWLFRRKKCEGGSSDRLRLPTSPQGRRRGVSFFDSSPSRRANGQNGISTIRVPPADAHHRHDGLGEEFSPVSDFIGLQRTFTEHEPTCNGTSTPLTP